MIEIPMTDDIRRYQPKVLGPFTLRQLVCSLLGVAVALPTWVLTKDMSIDNRILILAFAALPVMSCGWVKMDGLPLEMLVFRLIYFYFLTPKKRKYLSINTYKQAYDKGKASKTGKKPKKVKITYSSKKELKKYV